MDAVSSAATICFDTPSAWCSVRLSRSKASFS